MMKPLLLSTVVAGLFVAAAFNHMSSHFIGIKSGSISTNLAPGI